MSLHFSRDRKRWTIEARDRDDGQGKGVPDGWHIATTEDDPGRFHKSKVQAWAAMHRAVRAQLDAGWMYEADGIPLQTAATSPIVPCATLEQQVESAPDDDRAAALLADAWTQAGDPRGELMSLDRGLRGLTNPSQFMERKKAMRAAEAARNAHVLGPLGHDAYRVRLKFRRGLVDVVALPDELAAPGRPTHELVRHILVSPFARFLRELVVDAPELDRVAQVVGELGHPALRNLELIHTVDAEDEDDVHPPIDVRHTVQRLANLERLRVFEYPVAWNDLELPRLRSLDLSTTFVLDDVRAVLAWVSGHPRIEQLTLHTASEEPAVKSLLDAWTGDRSRWPASLQRVACDFIMRSK